ncbi:Collagen alpha-1(XXI) chain, partial [Colletotrichum sp. SAR11_59]
MSVGQLTSSAFVTCDPIPATVTVTSNVYTTVYTTTALAANPTTSWTATYTITEVCSGYPWEYKTHDIPPCFVPTTVYCEPCAQKTIPIICPAPSMTGGVVINGNGVTANNMPVITAAPYGVYGGYGSYGTGNQQQGGPGGP